MLVVLSDEVFNESQKEAIPGKKYPEKTPRNIARKIHKVRYLSKNLSLGFILLSFENLKIRLNSILFPADLAD
jgi:hypothetical protein